ncbi:MAG: uroporphyrinogen decarboxylase family protein [Candidatus Limivivens sp.]|nr:uroporphyrinogen decarboxylase family protein [Candidatus Limivivens sp.]
MTNKERILAALRGEPTDTLPFIPRLDNWYYAHEATNTLPDQYKHATLREFADDLGVGFHSIIPNFKGWRKGGYQDLHVGLGIYDLELSPWRVEFHNVGIKEERNAKGETHVEYDTPYGKISTTKVYTQEMIKGGATLHVIKEHALKSCDDYDALAYIFENAEVIPEYDAYTDYKENYIGDRGVAVALAAMWASSGHYLIKELMGFEDFYLERYDDPEAMEDLAKRLHPFCNSLFEAALNSPAEVILSGANYDFAFTTPEVVQNLVVPELKRQAEIIHGKGKFLATHTDGENKMLLDKYVAANIDIADSICPAPMTSVSLKETREIFDGKITIWGGIPSTALLPESVNDREFYKIVDETLEVIGRGDHMIISVADTLPPAADFGRLLYLKKKVEEFGPVR